jgi:nucleoside-diphosphate-sugar epimerase
MKILITGGTGNLSGRITETALEKNHTVALFNRGKQGTVKNTTQITGDINDIQKYSSEIEKFSPDAIIDTVCRTPKQISSLIDLSKNVKKLIFISTVDVYGEDVGCFPATEEKVPAPATIYGKDRYEAEKLLLEKIPDKAVIFRSSHILGKGFLTVSLWGRSPYIVDRILKGKPIPAIDGGRNLMTPVYSKDIAEWIFLALENDAAAGNIFNACGNEIVTQKYYYETIGKVLGKTVEIQHVPSSIFKKCFSTPSHLNFHRPYSNRKITELTKYSSATTLEKMINETVTFMIKNKLVKNSDEDPFDDKLSDLLKKHERELEELFLNKV